MFSCLNLCLLRKTRKENRKRFSFFLSPDLENEKKVVIFVAIKSEDMAKIYRHYKGNSYEYIGECLHSETLEEMVIYKALYGEGKTWVRPKSMFFENVILADGQTVPRFAPVE